MATSVWSNVAVEVQSALAAGVAITAISKANPGVCSTATTPTAGEYVLLKVSGMSQVNNRVFRVGTVVPSTSFQLEGENTTDYGTFTSGTYQTITFGTALSTITNVTASGGNARKVEDTTIHTDQVSQIPTVFEPIVYDMESQWIPGDAGLVALVSASANKQERAVRFSFADGRKSVFNAIPAVSFVPTGTAHDKVITPLSFDARARPTAYAT